MTRKEAERQTRQQDQLMGLGFTRDEAEQLRRISMTLRRWFEHECNGDIERDDNGEGLSYAVYHGTHGQGHRTRIPDRETGARKRLAAIVAARNAREFHIIVKTAVSTYIQTDPRGAALYILRPGDVPEGGDPSAYYSRGICVY